MADSVALRGATSDHPATASAGGGDEAVRRRWVMAICFLVWTLANFDQSLFSYALPEVLRAFHLPLEAAGVVLATSFACSSALVVLAGWLGDRYGRGLVMSALLGVSALCVGLQGFAAGAVSLTVARAAGFGLSGGMSPLTTAMVAENAPAKLRGVAMGVLQCGYPLGWLLASLLAAPLLERYGWRATFYTAFAVIPVALLIGLAFHRLQPPGSVNVGASGVVAAAVGPAARPRISTLFDTAHRGRTWASMGLFFLFGGAYAGSAFFFPTFFVTARGYAPAQAASLVGLSNGIAVFGYLGAAVAGEYWLRRRTVFIAWTLSGALAFLALIWLSHGRTSDLLWFAATGALSYGATAVAPLLVAEIFEHDIRATALGLCASAPLALGFTVFPLLTPLFVGLLGWQGGLSVVVAPALVGAALFALLLPARPSGGDLT